ncbi:MAG TPA: hypothetical protein ENH12_02970, partial [Proteobacteria bacterium]|nr:hypothetical protein [Pseudomonadota bacterium]
MLRFGLGLGVISYLIFFLSLIGALYSLLVFVVLLIPLIWFLLSRRKRSDSESLSLPILASVRSLSLIERVSFIILLAILLLNIIASLTPPYAGDAIGYHLPPARDSLLAHRLVWLPGNVLANQPAAVGTLFTIGFAGGGEFFPNLLHSVFGFMAAIGIYLFGRRYFRRSAAVLGALIFYTIPSVARISSWAYIDLGLTFWILLGLFAYLHWRDEENRSSRLAPDLRRNVGEVYNLDPGEARQSGLKTSPTRPGQGIGGSLIVSALFFGLAMGSKYTGLVLFSIMAVLALGECVVIKGRRHFLGRILIWAGIALAVASPWYLKNLYLTGNPFYPVLYSIFGGRGWDAVRAANFQIIIMGGMRMKLIDYLILPWSLTVRGAYTYDGFDGIIGPAFLIFLPLIIFVRKKNYQFRFLGIYSAVYFIIWAIISLKVRKLIPVLAPASLLAGIAITRLLNGGYSKFLKIIIVLILCLVIGFNIQAIVVNAAKINPLGVITGRESRDKFLSRMIYNYRVIDFTNRNLPPGSGILFIYGGNAWYYSRHKTVVDSIFQDQTIREILKQSDSFSTLLAAFRIRGITHILFNFSIAEKGLFSELSPDKKDLLRR